MAVDSAGSWESLLTTWAMVEGGGMMSRCSATVGMFHFTSLDRYVARIRALLAQLRRTVEQMKWYIQKNKRRTQCSTPR